MPRKTVKPQHKIDLILDELDRKILYHWDLNSRQSASQIAKLVGSNKDTVNFRMKKLIEKKVVTGFITEIDTAKLGYNNIKVYFQFKDFNKEIEKQFFEELKSMKNIGWVVSCSGRWDALFCFWARSTYHFHNEFIKILNKFSKHILNKQIIHNINWFYYNRKWLLKRFTQPLAIKYGGEPVKNKLDKLDKDILKELAPNARVSIVELANRFNQSSQNIINRIRKLEKEQIITKYSLNIDYTKIGYIFCKTFIYLQNISQKRLDELYKYCANQANIFALATTSGAWDLELEFEVENFEQMREVMDDIRIKFSDIITNYESVIITKQTSAMYIEE